MPKVDQEIVDELVDRLVDGNAFAKQHFPYTVPIRQAIDNVTALIYSLRNANQGEALFLTAVAYLELAAKHPTTAGHLMEELTQDQQELVSTLAEAIAQFCHKEFGW